MLGSVGQEHTVASFENMEKMERRFRVGGKQLLVFREMEVFLARVSLVEPRVENRFV